MHVTIIGAGEVGRSIAADLARDHHVAVIDTDADLVDDLQYSLDVLAIHGDGTTLDTLREADITTTDLVIACTDSDETNIVACGTAKTVTDAFTIARVRRQSLLTTWEGSAEAFGVDFMVSTDVLTAQTIVQICGLPAAQDVNMFAGGLVHMAQFVVESSSPIAKQTIRNVDHYDSLTFAAVFRDDEMIVATGTTRIRPGDRVVVIGSPESVAAFATDISPRQPTHSDEIVIIGGSDIGAQTAHEFETHGYAPTLIEHDPDRARTLSEALPETLVFENDPTDTDFLDRKQIGESDIVIAALNSDEKNLLVALLAQRLGADRTIAVIDNTEYTDLFETVGIDVAVNPRQETAEEIVRFTHEARTENIAILEHDRAEVIEFEVTHDSRLVQGSIQEVTDSLPDGVVIGAISRGGTHITPRGTTTIQPGDHVVVFVDAAVLGEVVDAVTTTSDLHPAMSATHR